MIRARVITATAWHTWQLLVVTLFLLLPAGRAWSQATDPALARLVQLAPGTRPLGVVLAELSRQGRLPLSYSSSLVPVAHPCHLPAGPARPLGVVLGEVLAAEHLAYGLLNGQLVLWPIHAPLPAGVVAVNGQPTRPGQPARSPVAATVATAVLVPVLAPATGGAGVAAHHAAAGSRAVGLSTSKPESGRSFSSEPIKQPTGGTAGPPSAVFGRSFSAKRPTPGVSKAAPATLPLAAFRRPRAAAPNPRQLSANERAALATPLVPKARSQPAKSLKPAIAEPAIAQSRPRPLGPRQGAPVASRQAAAASALSANATRVSAARASRTRVAQEQTNRNGGLIGGAKPAVARARSGEQRRPLALVQVPVSLLAPLRIMPTSDPAFGSLPLAIQPSAAQGAALVRNRAAEPDKSSPPDAKQPFALASLLHPSYLHAEAWTSETLPLSAVVKVGIPRIYLALGVAVGPLGRQSGGIAGGVGLGTVGQPRGRFTPSLDLVQWFVSGGNRETPGSHLTQLRPLLAWQIKQGGRLQLIAGPTLNLATGFRLDAGRTRGDSELGQGQWLWLNSGDEHTFLRLWPAVQLGLRF